MPKQGHDEPGATNHGNSKKRKSSMETSPVVGETADGVPTEKSFLEMDYNAHKKETLQHIPIGLKKQERSWLKEVYIPAKQNDTIDNYNPEASPYIIDKLWGCVELLKMALETTTPTRTPLPTAVADVIDVILKLVGLDASDAIRRTVRAMLKESSFRVCINIIRRFYGERIMKNDCDATTQALETDLTPTYKKTLTRGLVGQILEVLMSEYQPADPKAVTPESEFYNFIARMPKLRIAEMLTIVAQINAHNTAVNAAYPPDEFTKLPEVLDALHDSAEDISLLKQEIEKQGDREDNKCTVDGDMYDRVFKTIEFVTNCMNNFKKRRSAHARKNASDDREDTEEDEGIDSGSVAAELVGEK